MQRKAGFYWLTWAEGEGLFVGEYTPRDESWERRVEAGATFDVIGYWTLTGSEDWYYVDSDGVCRDEDGMGTTLIEVVAGPIAPPLKSEE